MSEHYCRMEMGACVKVQENGYAASISIFSPASKDRVVYLGPNELLSLALELTEIAAH